MTTLERVHAQTALLLEKQQEAHVYCNKLFDELLSLIDEKLTLVGQEKESKVKLQKIAELLTTHAKQFKTEIVKDISFLEGQLEVISSIQAEEDQVKRDELTNLIMAGEKPQDMTTFTQDLEVEMQEAKASFSIIINDIKCALAEKKIDEMLFYLQELEREKTIDNPSAACCSADGVSDGNCCGESCD